MGLLIAAVATLIMPAVPSLAIFAAAFGIVAPPLAVIFLILHSLRPAAR